MPPLTAVAQSAASSPAETAPAQAQVTTPKDISELLRRFVDADLPVSLSAPDGTVLSTSLWAEDPGRGLIVFAVAANDERAERVAECNEAVAVGYIDNIRLQFEVRGLVLVNGREASALNAEYPQEVLRFQRRGAYRVRPFDHALPVMHIRHPVLPEALLALRVSDISHGGVALMGPTLPGAYALGQVLHDAVLELDAHTQISLALRVVRLTEQAGSEGQTRLGCEMMELRGEEARLLQRYIDLTQRRRRMLAL